MNTEQFNKMLKELQQIEYDIMCSKGKDYTQGNEDRLINFKEAARELKVSPQTVWAVYFNKHVKAVLSSIVHNLDESEPLLERIADLRNYAFLGWALKEDLKEDLVTE
jgi:hypothetical protein